jgi:DNA-binding MarR family transcriptional regulator
MVKQLPTAARECAAAVLETVPHLMRVIRKQVRSQSNPDLSMPQFRTLAFIGRNAGAMLSDVAAFLALTPPAASKLVDGLFSAGLLAREIGSRDRRRVALRLTASGKRKFDAAVREAEAYLSARIEQLEPQVRGEVLRSMTALHVLFEETPEVRHPARARRAGTARPTPKV